MGRRKSHASSKRKQHVPSQRQLCLVERNELNALCDILFLSSINTKCVTQLWDNYVKMSTILEKVKRLEEMKTELPKRSQGIGQFMNWLKENGANVDGVSVSEFPGYDLGLKAEHDFHENELMLRIPRELIFSTQNAAPELSVLRYDPLIFHMPHVALAIALLIERHKENSKWKPYLDILPMTYSTVLYMTAADIAELKGSPTFEVALKLCRSIARQYSYFNQIFQNVNIDISDILRDVFTYERYW
ncbi:Actin-histidine N-methyltransferase [Anthophora retusa]